jgi:molybdenum cofactor cytidylyltransferase
MNFAVVLLAAGASSRMGRPKLLLPWLGTTVLGHLLVLWRELGAAQLAVVTAPGNAPVAAELGRAGVDERDRIINPKSERGMMSSIRCAAAWPGWRADLSHFLLTLGDQPHVQTSTLRSLVDFAGAHPGQICQPARCGRPRHPVLFPREIFLQLAMTPAENLKQFLLGVPDRRATFESEDAGLDFDLDEPADYERALLLCGAPSATACERAPSSHSS